MVFPKRHKCNFYRFQDSNEFVIWAKNLSWLSKDLKHSSLGHESREHISAVCENT